MIGELNQRVNLQYATLVPDEQGGFTETWATVASDIPAKVKPRRTTEAIVARQTAGISVIDVTIRYRSDVRSSWRVQHGSRYYAIIGAPVDVDNRHRWLVMECKEAA